VLEVLDVGARDQDALLDGEGNASVGNDEVAALAKGRDGAGDGRKAKRVEDGVLGAEEGGTLFLELCVHV